MANHKAPPPDWLTADYLQTILRNVLSDPDLEVRTSDIKPGSSVGDNYACQIFRIKMLLKTKGKEETLSIIGKFQPETRLLSSMQEKFDFFGTEAKFLKNMPPLFRKITPKGDEFTPKCLHVDTEKKLILMEDLVANGFQLQKRGVFLNRKQCELALEALATLHGSSYHAIQKDPSLKDAFGQSFWNNERNEPIEKMFINAQKVLERCVPTYGLSENYSKKLLGLMDKLNVDWIKVCNFQEGRLNFLLHGDSWMNNMMFRFQGGEARAIKLLDFQIINYNSFANDLQYFLFTSVSSDVLLNDLDAMLETYYNRLKSIAPNIPDLTLARVKSEFTERYYFGYLMAVAFRVFILSEEPPDMEEIMDGKTNDMGFVVPAYIEDLHRLLPFFEKVGVF